MKPTSHQSTLWSVSGLSSSTDKGGKRGFALIFTLSIILLLVVLVTGLLLFVRSQQLVAQPLIDQLRATANARLSASLALGQVQVMLGPDMRATASSEMQAVARGSGVVADGIDTFNVNRRRSVVVFDTSYPHNDINYPIISRLDDSGQGPYAYQTGLIDRRYSTFEYYDKPDYESNHDVSLFNWMINSVEDATDFSATARPSIFRGTLASGLAYDPTADPTEKSIALARFSFPDPLNPDSLLEDAEIEAELLDNENYNNLTGSFGFIIDDLSLRASLRPAPSADVSATTYTQDEWDWSQKLISQHSSIAVHEQLDDDLDIQWRSIDGITPISPEDAVALGLGEMSQWEAAESGYSFMSNRRVLSSSRLGALQKDLKAYLDASDSSLAGSAFTGQRVAKRDAGNASELSGEQQIAPIIPGRMFDDMGPSFESFRRFARLQDEVGEGSISQFRNSLRSTNKLGGVFHSSWQSMFTAEQGEEIGSPSEALGAHAQRIQPIMTEGSIWWTPSREDTDQGDLIYTHLHPKVKLWNPYSVDIPEQGYFVALPVVIRHLDDTEDFSWDMEERRFAFNFEFKGEVTDPDSGDTTTVREKVTLYPDELMPPYRMGGEKIALNGEDIDGDGDVIYRDYAVFYLEPTEIKAGECLVFTASPPSGASGLLTGPSGVNGTPTSAIYRIDDVTQNVLSAASVPNGSTYYIPADPSKKFDDSLKELDLIDVNRSTFTQILTNEDGNPILDDNGNPKTSSSQRNLLASGKSIDILFFANDSTSSGAVAEEALFNPSSTSDSYPLIQRICTTMAGSGDRWRGTDRLNPKNLDRENYVSQDFNGNGINEIGSFQDMGNTPPYSRWGFSGRLRSIDDSNNYYSNFGQTATTPDFFLRQSMFAQFNLRAVAHFRSAADHMLATSHSSHTFGAFYNPLEDNSLFDNSLTGYYNTYPSGNAAGSPFMNDGVPEDADKYYIYYDVPSDGWSPLSLIQFRHADFAPHPWAAGYPLGHGKIDYRTNTDSTAHSRLTETNPFWQWGVGPGENRTAIGSESGVKEVYLGDLIDYEDWVGGDSPDFSRSLSATNEADVIHYDYGYQLNHYLLDDYFLSTVSYGTNNELDWDWTSTPLNSRMVPVSLTEDEKAQIEASGHELIASGLFVEGAFNVNSTDVNAWAAFLASLRGQTRETLDLDEAGSDNETLYGRLQRPATADTGSPSDYFDPIAHSGAFTLSDTEIRTLAEKIVEVNLERGPALTIADFVSRPLTNQSQDLTLVDDDGNTLVEGEMKRNEQNKGNNDWTTSDVGFANSQIPVARRSRLEEAIHRAGLNQELMQFDALHVMSPQLDRLNPYELGANTERGWRNGFRAYNEECIGRTGNIETSQYFRDVQPEDELLDEWVTWGLAGWITQQDILEPLLPAMTTRGDTFVLRGFGSSENAGDGARRYLEVTVQRLPEFLHHEERNATSLTYGNRPQDAVVIENQETAAITNNDELSEVNSRFGRRFKIVSQRWIEEGDL